VKRARWWMRRRWRPRTFAEYMATPAKIAQRDRMDAMIGDYFARRSGELEELKAAGMYRDDGGPSFVERHGHRPDEPCDPMCRGNPAKLGGNGGAVWTPPPPDCPVTGWPQIDRDDLDMCWCGHRHITITAYGGGRSEP
jgi:hypothetical protein